MKWPLRLVDIDTRLRGTVMHSKFESPKKTTIGPLNCKAVMYYDLKLSNVIGKLHIKSNMVHPKDITGADRCIKV